MYVSWSVCIFVSVCMWKCVRVCRTNMGVGRCVVSVCICMCVSVCVCVCQGVCLCGCSLIAGLIQRLRSISGGVDIN